MNLLLTIVFISAFLGTVTLIAAYSPLKLTPYNESIHLFESLHLQESNVYSKKQLFLPRKRSIFDTLVGKLSVLDFDSQAIQKAGVDINYLDDIMPLSTTKEVISYMRLKRQNLPELDLTSPIPNYPPPNIFPVKQSK